jgi:hypothetical protein
MNEYEAKQERKRERRIALIAKLQKEGEGHLVKARAISNGIPFGQPILVGHHSEGRHRRDVDRIHRGHDRGHRALALAQKLENSLQNMGRSISADDPDAVTKYQEQLKRLEEAQGLMKAANNYFKKNGKLEGFEGPEWVFVGAESNLKFSYRKKPFPPFSLSNNSANIRRIKQRIEYLQREKATQPRPEIHGEGFSIIEDKADNRILLRFEKRLSKDGYKAVRADGWLWSPTRTAFVRQLNNLGRYRADLMASQAGKLINP